MIIVFVLFWRKLQKRQNVVFMFVLFHYLLLYLYIHIIYLLNVDIVQNIDFLSQKLYMKTISAYSILEYVCDIL